MLGAIFLTLNLIIGQFILIFRQKIKIESAKCKFVIGTVARGSKRENKWCADILLKLMNIDYKIG